MRTHRSAAGVAALLLTSSITSISWAQDTDRPPQQEPVPSPASTATSTSPAQDPATQLQSTAPPLSEAASQPWIQKIVVTAQKREQEAENVPIAMTVLSGDELLRSGAKEFAEIVQYTPGLQYFKSTGVRSSNLRIRGIGTSSFNDALEPSVGVFVDGVYMSRQGMGLDDLVDVERVEVLRGPQGTLFGRNTPAGAVHVITKAPSDEQEAVAQFSYGNYNYLDAQTTVSGPVAPGIKTRLTGFFTRRDGVAENVEDDEGINKTFRYGLRGKAEVEVNEDLIVTVAADYYRTNELCCTPVDSVRTVTRRQNFRVLGGGPIPSGDLEDREVGVNSEQKDTSTNYGLSVTADLQVPGHTVTSITAYRWWNAGERIDTDFGSWSAYPLSAYDTDIEQFTQEFRIANNDTSKFSYVAGLYYYLLNIQSDVRIPSAEEANAAISSDLLLRAIGVPNDLLPGLSEGVATGTTTINDVLSAIGQETLGGLGDAIAPGNGFTLAQVLALTGQADLIGDLDPGNNQRFQPVGGGVVRDNNSGQTQSLAVFADGTYNVTDDFLVTLGGRFTHEYKEANGSAVINDPAMIFFPQSPAYNLDFTDSQATGRLSLQYFFNDDVMTFVNAATGYKSGGINLQRLAFGTERTVEAEKSRNIEVGVKSTLLEGRLALNATAYRTIFDDFQSNAFDGTQFNLFNAGKVRTQGIEAEAVYRPIEALTISSGLEYNQAEFVEYENGPVSSAQSIAPDSPDTQDLSDREVPDSPDWRGHVVATYTKELRDDLNGYVRGEYSFTGARLTQATQDPRTRESEISIINARVGVIVEERNMDVSLWGKNLLDQEYALNVTEAPGQPGSFSSYLGAPRTFGISLRITNR